MSFRERFPILLRIALFCALIAVLGLWPHPRSWSQALAEARQAAGQARFAPAAEALDRALAYQPWRADLWEQLGRMQQAAGKPAEAAQAFQQASALGALSASGRLAYGDALLQQKDASAALQAWQPLLEGQPDAQLFERVVRTRRSLGDFLGSIETLRRWVLVEPGNAAARFQLGCLLLWKNDRPAALTELEQAVSLDSNRSAQVETLRRAIALADASSDPAYQQLIAGRALASVEQWDLAHALFLSATGRAPQYAEAWAFLGEAQQQLGQSGFASLEKARQLAPNSLVVQALTAVYWRRQGRPDLALEGLKKMTAQEPGQAVWQVEAGSASAEAGDLLAALGYYQRATQLEPGNPTAWKALARFSIAYDSDVAGLGLPAARTALSLAADDPDALDLMGQAFLHLGDLVSAERFLQRALQADPASPAAHLHLGQVYLQSGRPDLAYGPLTAAQNLDTAGAYGRLAQRLLAEYFPPGG